MTELHAANTKGEKTFYEPVLSRITGKSQYRDTEYRLEGIEGYWNAGELPVAQAVIDGAVAWFTLACKPKTGAKAKPGSMYQDIVSIKPATPDDKASYNPSPPSPADYIAPEPATGQNGAHSASTGSVWDVRDQQIKLGMAFNNLTTMLAAGAFNDPQTTKGAEIAQAMWDQWWNWYDEAAGGRPLSPATIYCSCDCGCQNNSGQGRMDSDVCTPCASGQHKADSPLVRAAKVMGATVIDEGEAAASEDTPQSDPQIEELPW